MANFPKQLAHKFFPGLGDQYEIGAVNLGVSVVDCTIVASSSTAMTDAQLIAGPANTNTNVNACGPIVHSLGATPTFALLQPRGTSLGNALAPPIFVTADHSAVYFRTKAYTADALGYSVRLIAFR